MKKTIKKTGGSSLGIRFSSHEREHIGIEEGDVIEVEIIKIERKINGEIG